MNDPLILGGKEFQSRFLLGTGKFSLDKQRKSLSGETWKS